MKRWGSLWEHVTDFANLVEAARRAQLGKRYRPDVLAFHYNLERNLHALREALLTKTYQPGPYRTFVIFEPKRRLISAAPYGDRVVHHALCNVIEPLFDATFIDSSYANRKGKGSRAALDHFVALSRRYPYCLRADIEKYFPSIDHAILKAEVRRKIKCADTLRLIDLILDASNAQEPVEQWFPGDTLIAPAERRNGLPIGNLTSQLWANVYLNPVDHAVAAQFGGARYVRFVDDFAVFFEAATDAESARGELERLLLERRLRLHPVKTGVMETRHGVNFLGFRIFPERIRIRQENLRRARRRMRGMQGAYRKGELQWDEVKASLQSWNAHAAYGDTWRLRKRVFDSLVFTRS